jgi:uncharacterized protein YndB with AHSA1/START domain
MEPLTFSFRVERAPAEAFRLWTQAASLWWPMATHSVSSERDASIVLEPRVGGRIFERVPDGREFDWGSVVVFEPPWRLVCEWLIADLATELEVRFTDPEDGGTLVLLEHRGWEQFGDQADDRRDTNAGGWEVVLPLYTTACAMRSSAAARDRA